MKSLRRSLNNNNNNGSSSSPQPSPPLPGGSASHPLGRPSEKVAPPQKVIKALESHRSTNPQELSYTKGDFWYVTGERDAWYEALNPLTGSRGLVPKADFEEFIKGGRHPSGQKSVDHGRPYTPSQGHMSSTSDPRSPSDSVASPSVSSEPKRQKQPVYAIVQYDFHAERPDELDAKKGEPIVVIAQSNHEWFVAKPIGRLGGPGLIPVAFVEIRDPSTGRPIEMLPNTIPAVEEWKKATAEYKAAAIPLGRLDIPPGQAVVNSPYAPSNNNSASSLPRAASSSSVSQQQQANGRSSAPPSEALYRPEVDPTLPPGDVIELGIPSFHSESGSFWFRLNAKFIPDEPSAPAYNLALYRSYEDFYDFQISLLDTFPYEAGRSRPGEEDRSPPERILPYMPGPVEGEVDRSTTEYRMEELDAYVQALVDLRTRAGYIMRHELVRTFLAAKYGDYCDSMPRADALGQLEERLADMRVNDGSPAGGHQRGYSSGGGQPDPRAPSAASRHSSSNNDRYSPQLYNPAHQAASRSISSRGASPLPPIDTSRPSSGRQPSGLGSQPISAGPNTAGSSWTHHAGPSSATSASAPAASGQPPYIKIKIYDRATDDLIAIRVHPSVSHSELFEKVRARLGPGVTMLRYRTSMDGAGGQGYRELRDDRELKEWMRAEDQKLVLYAEQ
ncbi:hypothetical protein IAU60_000482 [Kwoniella sp. DSM 27419]